MHGRRKLYGGTHELPHGVGEYVAQDDTEDGDLDSGVEDNSEGFGPEGDLGQAATMIFRLVHQHQGFDDDDEREQMLHDMPCFPVFTLEPKIFNGRRHDYR